MNPLRAYESSPLLFIKGYHIPSLALSLPPLTEDNSETSSLQDNMYHPPTQDLLPSTSALGH